MNYPLLFTALLFTISSAAQDCSKESLRNKQGTWKAGPDNYEGIKKAIDFSKLKGMLGK